MVKTQGSREHDVHDVTAIDVSDVEEWARPAYAESYRLYLLDGARYGHHEEGMMRWIREQVAKQRRKAGER